MCQTVMVKGMRIVTESLSKLPVGGRMTTAESQWATARLDTITHHESINTLNQIDINALHPQQIHNESRKMNCFNWGWNSGCLTVMRSVWKCDFPVIVLLLTCTLVNSIISVALDTKLDFTVFKVTYGHFHSDSVWKQERCILIKMHTDCSHFQRCAALYSENTSTPWPLKQNY